MKRLMVSVVTLFVMHLQPAQAADFPIVHPNEITARYGKADRIVSTENEKPRPFIVTKFVEYSTENVRFIFTPKGKVSDPPPYSTWQLLGAQDMKTGRAISADEAESRLAKRDKKMQR